MGGVNLPACLTRPLITQQPLHHLRRHIAAGEAITRAAQQHEAHLAMAVFPVLRHAPEQRFHREAARQIGDARRQAAGSQMRNHAGWPFLAAMAKPRGKQCRQAKADCHCLTMVSARQFSKYSAGSSKG